MDENAIHYCCPHCRGSFPVGEDSEEYLIPCPRCGQTLDLTELEPIGLDTEAPPKESVAGLVIEESITEVRPGGVADPTAKAIENAILSASASAGNAAAAGLRVFRRIRHAFSPSTTSSPLDCSSASKPATIRRAAFVPSKTSPGKTVKAPVVVPRPPVGASMEDGRTAFREGRVEEGVAIFRRAAGKGDRTAMMALSGCLLKGVGTPPDKLAAQLWQSKAGATPAEVEEVFRSFTPTE